VEIPIVQSKRQTIRTELYLFWGILILMLNLKIHHFPIIF
jgi:hypothetical protein